MSSISVKELANELNITKQAVHKRINQLPPNLKPKMVKGAYKLTVETSDYIRSAVLSSTSDNQPVNQSVDDGLNNKKDSYKSAIKKQVKRTETVEEQPFEYIVGKNGEPSTDNQPVDDKVDVEKLLLDQKDNEIDRMAKELKEKNKQIDKLQELLDQQQKLLDQQQQLALQTQLQNNKLQLQLEEVESKVEAEKEVESDAKQSNKKWWHFFK